MSIQVRGTMMIYPDAPDANAKQIVEEFSQLFDIVWSAYKVDILTVSFHEKGCDYDEDDVYEFLSKHKDHIMDFFLEGGDIHEGYFFRIKKIKETKEFHFYDGEIKCESSPYIVIED